MSKDQVAHPFVKWAGGKTQLLEPLSTILPSRIRTYYEPFIGGGALFFSLAQKERFQRAVINDWNTELVDAYKTIRDFPDDLITLLQALKETYQADARGTFQGEREKDPKEMTPIQRAARFIFLNKTGFNGLYRVNKKGGFNTPFGKYENPKILDEPNIRACSKVLNHFVVVTSGDFAQVIADAQPGDCVYFDPPYVPVNATANFTSYTSDGFSLDDQYRLAAAFKKLAENGVAVVASNSDTQTVRDLYEGFEMHNVQARRNINSKGDKRGPVGELIIVGRRGTVLPSVAPKPPRAETTAVDYYDDLSELLEQHPPGMPGMRR